MKKKIIAIVIIILLLIIGYGIYYINDYYHADESVDDYINGSDNITVIKTSNGLLLDGEGNDTAVIFYPGAKIEYTSYLPFLTKVANEGVDCFIVEMPFNLALLGENSADEIIDSYNYSNYYISGHSLGGVVASQYVNSTNKTDALILIGSYSTSEISKPVLSIYGSEDKVLNMENYNESKKLFKNMTEVIIDGGNHAQIGNYGNQSGDGIANISSDEQQQQTANAIIDFISIIN